jgi:hypothetical protein
MNCEYYISNDGKYVDQTCCICMEKVKYGTITECGHLYHNTCLQKWVIQKRNCPLCRNDFVGSVIYDINTISKMTIKQQMLDSVRNYIK